MIDEQPAVGVTRPRADENMDSQYDRVRVGSDKLGESLL